MLDAVRPPRARAQVGRTPEATARRPSAAAAAHAAAARARRTSARVRDVATHDDERHALEREGDRARPVRRRRDDQEHDDDQRQDEDRAVAELRRAEDRGRTRGGQAPDAKGGPHRPASCEPGDRTGGGWASPGSHDDPSGRRRDHGLHHVPVLHSPAAAQEQRVPTAARISSCGRSCSASPSGRACGSSASGSSAGNWATRSTAGSFPRSASCSCRGPRCCTRGCGPSAPTGFTAGSGCPSSSRSWSTSGSGSPAGARCVTERRTLTLAVVTPCTSAGASRPSCRLAPHRVLRVTARTARTAVPGGPSVPPARARPAGVGRRSSATRRAWWRCRARCSIPRLRDLENHPDRMIPSAGGGR